MKRKKTYRIAILLVALVIGFGAFAQNTKGDKPASIPAAKGKNIKSKSRKNVSSRVNANQSLLLVKRSTPNFSRLDKAFGGGQVRVRSSPANRARNYSFPTKSREPQNSVSIQPRSNSRPFRTKRKTNANVYWGKIRRGVEKSVNTDIAGRRLRSRDFHSVNPGLVIEKKSSTKRETRREGFDRNSLRNRVAIASPAPNQHAWRGDISGRPLRNIQPRPNEVIGKNAYRNRLNNISTLNPKLSLGNFSGDIKSKRKSYSQIGLYSGDITGGQFIGSNTNGIPLDTRVRARGLNISAKMRNYSGHLLSSPKPQGIYTGKYPLRVPLHAYFDQGALYSGGIKARNPKGGVSTRNEKYPLRVPIHAYLDQGTLYSGNIKSQGFQKDARGISGNLTRKDQYPLRVAVHAFSYQGAVYSGNIKSQGLQKDARGISGSLTRKDKYPLRVAVHTFSYQGAVYSGNIKSQSLQKDARGISGNLTRKDQYPLRVAVHTFSYQGAVYSGNIKSQGLQKDARGISGNLTRKDQYPLRVAVHAFSYQGAIYAGSMKARDFQKETKAISKNLTRKDKYPVRVAVHTLSYQGAVYVGTMKAYRSALVETTHGEFHPDAEFAHGNLNNVKKDRTILVNIKLTWSKIFRKNAIQPGAVKDKIPKMHYDKKEKELWKDLYD